MGSAYYPTAQVPNASVDIIVSKEPSFHQSILIACDGFYLTSFHFQTAAVVGDQQSAEDRAEGIFNKMDVNSDGKVTRCSSTKTHFTKVIPLVSTL